MEKKEKKTAAPKATPKKENPKAPQKKEAPKAETKPAKKAVKTDKKAEPAKSEAPKATKKEAKAAIGSSFLTNEEEGEELDEETIKSIETIKKDFLKKGKANGSIEQDDVMDATSKLDLTDDEFESLIDYFRENKIKVVSDDEEDSLDDAEIDESKIADAEKEIAEDD